MTPRKLSRGSRPTTATRTEDHTAARHHGLAGAHLRRRVEARPRRHRMLDRAGHGETLATIGLADPEDVTNAAVRAVAAQREWAARSAFERAAVLRRAAQLLQEHAQECTERIVRESGGVRGKGAHQVSLAVAECLADAETATSSYGDLLRSALPRLSLERRIPVGSSPSSRRSTPRSSCRSAPSRRPLALGNAVLLKPDQRTTVCGGVLLAPILAEAGVPRGGLPAASRRGGGRRRARPGAAGPGRGLYRLDSRGPAHRGGGGPDLHPHPPGAGRKQPPDRPPRRGCRTGRRPRRLRELQQLRAGVHGSREAPRPREPVSEYVARLAATA